LSKGYVKLGKLATQLTYFPSAGTLKMGSKQWNQLLFRHFGSFLAVSNPKVVVFDGTYLYQGLVQAVQAVGIPLVWIRRGRWKFEVREASHQYNFPEKYCDYVIQPGEFAQDPVRNGGSRFSLVDPILVFHPHQIESKEAAIKSNKLDPKFKYVLIQIGAGNINEIDGWLSEAVKSVFSLGKKWKPVVVKNPLRGDSLRTSGVVEI